METNIQMRSEMERNGGVIYKKYRIFQKSCKAGLESALQRYGGIFFHYRATKETEGDTEKGGSIDN
jgi:hypothetical protein